QTDRCYSRHCLAASFALGWSLHSCPSIAATANCPHSSYSCFFAPRLLSAHVISLHLLRVSALESVLRPARPETRTGRCKGGGCSGKVWRSKPGAPFLGREMPPPASPGEAPRSRATSRARLYRKNRRWWPGQGPCLRLKAGIQLSRRM